jgi:hypothetical protein
MSKPGNNVLFIKEVADHLIPYLINHEETASDFYTVDH